MSTPPVGLAGELMTISLVRGVTSEASSSGSRRNSFSWRIGIGDRRAADEARHRLVDRVAGVRDDDLVAGVDQGQDRVVHDALAADRHEHALGATSKPRRADRVGGDGGAQLGDAGERRVVRRAGVEGALGGLADVGRRVEVRLADLEVDHARGRSPRARGRGRRPRRPSRCRCPRRAARAGARGCTPSRRCRRRGSAGRRSGSWACATAPGPGSPSGCCRRTGS